MGGGLLETESSNLVLGTLVFTLSQTERHWMI